MTVAEAPAGGPRRRAADTVPAAGAMGTSGATTRDPRLDFYRGIAMFIILIAHTPGNVVTLWIPARWGFSDATEIFVFCSGMASAVAFGRAFERRGWGLGTARVAFRVWQVYWAHLGMFFVIATIMAALDMTGWFERVYIGSLNLWNFFSDPGPQLVGLFTLTYVPNYFDILPMYLVILAMMPLVVALHRIGLWAAVAGCVALWTVAQEPLMVALGLGHLSPELPAEPWSDREWFFNPFGWQLVFFTGFALMRGWLPRPPVRPWLIGLALAVVLINVPLSDIGVRVLNLDWAFDWRGANRALIAKTDFGLLRYVHFLALAYLAWVVAGEGGRYLIADPGRLAGRVWGEVVRQVSRVGQQSLAVFLFSMVLARLIGVVFDVAGRGPGVMLAANLAGAAALIAVAHAVGWFKSQPWRDRRR